LSDASPAAPLDSSPVDKVSQDVRGIWLAVVCHILWGLLPLYFRLLHAVSPFEIVAQRVIWSLLLVLVLIALRTGLPSLLAVLRDQRVMWPLTASAILIAVNWLVYVWAVHADHVVAASLGYFLNPLVNVLLGVTFLHERLGRGQILALLIVATGVSILAVAAADTLWVSLAIAL
jgi:chloramphenicol-sensitive protein RarD